MQTGKEPIKLTAVEEMLFAADDDDQSDCSDDNPNETNVGKVQYTSSLREQSHHIESNEESSIRGAPPSSVANGGRP